MYNVHIKACLLLKKSPIYKALQSSGNVLRDVLFYIWNPKIYIHT